MKLIATYVEGFAACFTESRTGMKQRALIDIGDTPPTPQELADLASILSDQWGWMNRLEHPAGSVRKGELTSVPREKRTREKEISTGERRTLILQYLAQHPDSGTRAIVEGLGYQPDEKRIARWAFTLATMDKAGAIISRKVREGMVNRHLYSINGGKS